LASEKGSAAQAPRRWSQVCGSHPEESIWQDHAEDSEGSGEERGWRCAGEREQALRVEYWLQREQDKVLDGRKNLSLLCAQRFISEYSSLEKDHVER